MILNQFFIKYGKNKIDFIEELEKFTNDGVFIATPQNDLTRFSAHFRHRPINLVHVRGHVESIPSIIAAAHELGHLAFRKTISAKQNKNMWQATIERQMVKFRGKAPDQNHNESLGRVLYDERAAWAWAVKKLKPFLPVLGICEKDLDEFYHAALSGYSE